MKKIWITYSWEDNKGGDVNYLARQLSDSGLTVRLDKWEIKAGLRLWDQISKFITDTSECDAWALYATQASLLSEACQEELAYALDRSLRSRDIRFPLIGISPGDIDINLIPPAIRTRLFVNTTDSDWVERIKASVENRELNLPQQSIEPFELIIHKNGGGFWIEARPRAGVWGQAMIGIPIENKGHGLITTCVSSKYNPPTNIVTFVLNEFTSTDGKWRVYVNSEDASPTRSIYISVRELPSRLIFGSLNGPRYEVEVANSYLEKF